MKKVYRVFQPYAGIYTDCEDLNTVSQMLAKAAWDSYLILTHNNPVAEITVNSDGSQIWRNLDGSHRPSPEEFETYIQQYVEHSVQIADTTNTESSDNNAVS
jgi:hypothetical protein